MRLTVVGCAGSYPNGDSPASCYVVEHDGHRLLLDMGNGSLGAVHRILDPLADDAIDAVLLSHCHIDHCADLASLFVARHHYGARSLAPLLVVGPSDAADRLAAIYGMRDPALIGSSFDMRVHQPTRRIGPFTVTAARAAHPVEAYSIRVEAAGRSITYSGDTGPTRDLVELAAGTDVALFEASFLGRGHPPDLHLSAMEAGETAARAGAGSLVLTHLLAGNDPGLALAEAGSVFSGPTRVAQAGLTLEV